MKKRRSAIVSIVLVFGLLVTLILPLPVEAVISLKPKPDEGLITPAPGLKPIPTTPGTSALDWTPYADGGSGIYLKLSGITGDYNKTPGHQGEIELQTYGMGAKQGSSTGAGISAGRIQLDDVMITKNFDSTSPGLFLACCLGQHFSEAIINFAEKGKGGKIYYKVRLSDIIISSVKSGKTTADSTKPVEEVTLNYGKIEVFYATIKPDGTQGEIKSASYSQQLQQAGTGQTPPTAPSTTGQANDWTPYGGGQGIFLKMTGIDGEYSGGPAHNGEITLTSYSQGVSKSGGNASGSGSGAGKAQLEGIVVTKKLDKASPLLFYTLASKKRINEAVINFVQPGGGGSKIYGKVVLTNVMVSSFKQNLNNSDFIPVEELNLTFERIQVIYREVKPDGTQGPPVKAGYDLKLRSGT